MLEKIEKLKGLLAHSNPNISLHELLHKLCDLGLKNFDPGQKIIRKSSDLNSGPNTSKNLQSGAAAAEFHERSRNDAANIHISQSSFAEKIKCPFVKPVSMNLKTTQLRKPIPRAVKREIWQKAKSQCENCGSRYALQIDHIIPISFQGTNAKENLRILCRSCNQRQAVEKIGAQKMMRFL